MALLAISWPVAAYVFLVMAIISVLVWAVIEVRWFLRMSLPVDGESMNDEPPTLDVQNHKGDR